MSSALGHNELVLTISNVFHSSRTGSATSALNEQLIQGIKGVTAVSGKADVLMQAQQRGFQLLLHQQLYCQFK